MASVNKVIIVGNLGRDPEMRSFPSGDRVAAGVTFPQYSPGATSGAFRSNSTLLREGNTHMTNRHWSFACCLHRLPP